MNPKFLSQQSVLWNKRDNIVVEENVEWMLNFGIWELLRGSIMFTVDWVITENTEIYLLKKDENEDEEDDEKEEEDEKDEDEEEKEDDEEDGSMY